VWTYDATNTVTAPGQLLRTATTTTEGTTSWTYTTEVSLVDDKKRPTKTKVTLPNLSALGAFASKQFETTVAYDTLGRASTTTLPEVPGIAAAETITSTFDAFGQPKTLTATGVGSIMSNTTYTADGLTYTRSLANAVTREISWDPTYRTPTRLQATQTGNTDALQDDTYVRDGVGRVKSIVDDVAQVRQCYTYEAYNRLSAAWTQSAAPQSAACSTSAPTDTSWNVGDSAYTASWTYSPAGSIATRVQAAHTVESTTEQYFYDEDTSPAAVTKTTSTDEDAYKYDEAGRMTERLGQTLTWDGLSNLTTLTQGSTTTTYLYDDAGQRYAVLTASTQTGVDPTATIYMGAWEATDPDASDNAATGVSVTRYYTAGGTQLASKTTGGTLLVTLGDIQGSAQLTIGPSGTTGTNAYTPYGAKRTTAAPLTPGHGWLNQIADTTGLTYLNARYYDPTLGRFISPDPILNPADPRTLDPYRYADNNPVLFSDANGLNPGCAGMTGLAADRCWSSYASVNATDPETKAAHGLIVQNAKGTIDKPQGTNCWYMGTTCRSIDIWNSTMPFTHISVGQAVGYNRLLAVLNTPEIHVESVLESVGATFGITANEFFFGDIERCVGGDRGSCAWAVAGMVPGVGKFSKMGKLVEASEMAKATKSVDELYGSATTMLPGNNGLTAVGRSYQKHAQRGEFPLVSTAGDMNSAGANVLLEILTNPGTRSTIHASGSLSMIAPDGTQARFLADGSLKFISGFSLGAG
jgi:RHS repeat-associated protein